MAHEGEIREMVARISELMGPAVESPLVGALWDRYVATLAGKAWVKQTGYMMRRVLSAWSSRRVDSLRVSDWSDLRDSESFRKLAPRPAQGTAARATSRGRNKKCHGSETKCLTPFRLREIS